MMETFLKCSHCPRGWRAGFGANCVVCGWGPSPMHWSFWTDKLPETEDEIDEALTRLANGTWFTKGTWLNRKSA